MIYQKEMEVFYNTNKRNGEYLTSEEQCVARWAYENGQRAGVTTTHFSSAKCLYLSIRSGESVYGVIGIPVKKDARILLNIAFYFL